jgi:hypothetical protein
MTGASAARAGATPRRHHSSVTGIRKVNPHQRAGRICSALASVRRQFGLKRNRSPISVSRPTRST